MADRIEVRGLKEFRRELKALDGQWEKQLQKANKAVAEMVAEGTREDFQRVGGSGPKAASTVKALAQQTRAQVKFGGKGDSVAERVAGGNAFGSTRFPQFPKPGVYALYPTLARRSEDITDRYADLVDDLMKRAFPD